MKKKLRSKLPRTPLKVLRGEQDQEDIRDIYHERFQSPGTTTEDPDDHRDIEDESRRSSLSRDYVTTDIGEVSDEGRARYLSDIDSDGDGDIDIDGDGDGDIDGDGDSNVYSNRSSLQRDEVSETDNDNDDDTDDYSNMCSLLLEGTSTTEDNIHDNDNDSASQGEARRLDNDNTGYQTTGSVSEEAIELQVIGQAHHPPHTNSDQEDTLSRDDSHAV